MNLDDMNVYENKDEYDLFFAMSHGVRRVY